MEVLSLGYENKWEQDCSSVCFCDYGVFQKSKTTVKFRDCLGLDHLNLRVIMVTFPMTYCNVYSVTGQVDRKPFI